MPGKDTFIISGSAPKKEFDLSDLQDDQVVAEFDRRANENIGNSTNPLKRSHALLTEKRYFSAQKKAGQEKYPDFDALEQFRSDVYRNRVIINRQIQFGGESARNDKDNIRILDDAFDLNDPDKQKFFLYGLNQTLAADARFFIDNNYEFQLSGKKMHGKLEVVQSKADIEYEKTGDVYSYNVKVPISFFRSDDGETFWLLKQDGEFEAISSGDFALDILDKKDPDGKEIYKPIGHLNLKASVDNSIQPPKTTIRIEIDSQTPALQYIGPKSDPDLTMQIENDPLSISREQLFSLANDFRKKIQKEINNALESKRQTKYLDQLQDMLKEPAFLNCLNIKAIPNNEEGLKASHREFNQVLEKHKDIQKKPGALRRFTNYLGLTKPEPSLLDSFRQDFLVLVQHGPFSLQSQPLAVPSEKATVVHVEPKPSKKAATNNAAAKLDKKVNLDVGSIVQVQEQFEQLDKAKKPKIEQPQEDIKDKKPYLIPHVTPEQHKQHKTLMTELMGKFKKNEDGAAVDNKPDNKPKGMPPKGK